jgi:exopolyphosphatase / guanosine-5'-triphosphate,3'-diphosphate pyrophosphatase
MLDTNRSFKLFIIGVVLIFASLIPYYWGVHQVATSTVVRAALDIGSGATKLRVSEIDLKNNKIVRTLVNQQIAVPYQLSLSQSDDHRFDEEIMQEGIEAIQKLKKIAMDNQAEKIVGIATASFRKAQNGEAFVKRIFEETKVPVFIVDQELEGELGFYAVEATIPVDEERMIVWDIGGGSLQFTALDKEGNIVVYRGHEASIPFRQYVMQNIQGRDVKVYDTPNPLTLEDMSQAEKHARDLASRVDDVFKERLKDEESDIYGVGSIFSLGIEPLVRKSTFTVKELTEAVRPLAGKTDEELGGGDFADVQVTNALLVIGFMDELEIKEVTVVDVNAADGAFFIKRFWKPQEALIEEAQ